MPVVQLSFILILRTCFWNNIKFKKKFFYIFFPYLNIDLPRFDALIILLESDMFVLIRGLSTDISK